MTESIKVECDYCHADITRANGAVPAFRLVLDYEHVAATSGVLYDSSASPPIDGTKHFCGLVCLSGWLFETHGVSTVPEGAGTPAMEWARQALPAPEKRVETGVVQFGDDWPGVFIRGANAANYARALRAFVMEMEPDSLRASGKPSRRDTSLAMKGLADLLESSNVLASASAFDSEIPEELLTLGLAAMQGDDGDGD